MCHLYHSNFREFILLPVPEECERKIFSVRISEISDSSCRELHFIIRSETCRLDFKEASSQVLPSQKLEARAVLFVAILSRFSTMSRLGERTLFSGVTRSPAREEIYLAAHSGLESHYIRCWGSPCQATAGACGGHIFEVLWHRVTTVSRLDSGSQIARSYFWAIFITLFRNRSSGGQYSQTFERS